MLSDCPQSFLCVLRPAWYPVIKIYIILMHLVKTNSQEKEECIVREYFTVSSDTVHFFFTKSSTVYDEGIKTTEISFM
jgi:hypothetical protein